MASLLDGAAAGKRLSAEEAVMLHDEAPLGALGLAAHRRRLQLCDPRTATYVIDRNISLTNVCEAQCRFCAFHVQPGSPDAFVLTVEEVIQKVEDAGKRGATQVMIQGGLNPQLNLAFYEQILRAIKRQCNLWVHSLSPAEVAYLADGAGLSLPQCLSRLREAGLDSLPGGGAEILVDAVRQRVSPYKISAGRWLAVMEAAHGLGMSTTATMVYGLGETPAQRIQHMLAIRELQDRTSGFTAFIPWSCQTNRTGIDQRPSTGVDYLRMVALSRLVLDNMPHLQAGWVTEGPDVAQLALSFGADDFGGVLMEEKVVRATGVQYAITAGQVIELIRKAGYTPAQRTTRYEIIATVSETSGGTK
ncbi:MAG: dehypoxanthine futalosine cyclase [Lentisphaerae bacterium RIFOXYC12_FULL_60_16]|nr:MAG: dehypoxanthine futalosine cyclase [Lentisphaerae bacterium RIFOXYC12_FULL_60_16]OGV74970.1 MAG: dehypoxanthine futalosine cyclase [Lentisphaerae bacterium RIFOXYA12_FULL_60_10]OGV84794.1 MAG: dehypoxanthine futalosine cyclase [Lentisphaerae bacterium RIFOXYB12_FULL_60_10]